MHNDDYYKKTEFNSRFHTNNVISTVVFFFKFKVKTIDFEQSPLGQNSS